MAFVSGLGGATDLAHHSPITRHRTIRMMAFPTISDTARRKLPSIVKYRIPDAFQFPWLLVRSRLRARRKSKIEAANRSSARLFGCGSVGVTQSRLGSRSSTAGRRSRYG